eukprot:m51a1_g3405 hypothetical protein (178) ;mRNA; f:554253-554854
MPGLLCGVWVLSLMAVAVVPAAPPSGADNPLEGCASAPEGSCDEAADSPPYRHVHQSWHNVDTHFCPPEVVTYTQGFFLQIHKPREVPWQYTSMCVGVVVRDTSSVVRVSGRVVVYSVESSADRRQLLPWDLLLSAPFTIDAHPRPIVSNTTDWHLIDLSDKNFGGPVVCAVPLPVR